MMIIYDNDLDSGSYGWQVEYVEDLEVSKLVGGKSYLST